MRATVTWTVRVNVPADQLTGKSYEDKDVACELAMAIMEETGPDTEYVEWEEE